MPRSFLIGLGIESAMSTPLVYPDEGIAAGETLKFLSNLLR